MAKQNSFPVIKKGTWSTAGSSQIELPKSGYITHLDCQLKIVYDTGAAVTAASDPIARVISSMNISASGTRGLIHFSDGRQWRYWNHLLYKGRLRHDTISTVINQVDLIMYAQFPVHIGLFPHDFHDPTGVIPAAELSDLIMEIDWAADSIMGTGYTLKAGTELTLTNHELALDSPAEKAVIWAAGLPNPRFEPRIISPVSTYSGFGLESDFPTGDTVIRTLVMNLDSSGDRSDTELTELQVKFPIRRTYPWQRDWIPFVDESKARWDLATRVTGIGMIEGSSISGRPLGLDLSKAQTGDANIGFTVGTSGGAIHLLHQMMS